MKLSSLSVWRWPLVLLIVAAVILVVVLVQPEQYLNLDWLRNQHDSLTRIRASHPIASAAIYFGAYFAMVALWIPGATMMTLAGGAVFGFWQGVVLVSFASSSGATVALLLSRFLLGSWVQERFADRIGTVNAEFDREGPLYLFAMRMVPLVPFALINLLMGWTRIPAFTFYWVSQVGMLAGTAMYVFTGAHLASIRSIDEAISTQTAVVLAMLGLSPILFRKLVRALRVRRQHRS